MDGEEGQCANLTPDVIEIEYIEQVVIGIWCHHVMNYGNRTVRGAVTTQKPVKKREVNEEASSKCRELIIKEQNHR